MSHKTYLEDLKRMKRRNPVAKNSYQHGGPHTKPYKSQRAAAKKNLRTHFDDIMSDLDELNCER